MYLLLPAARRGLLDKKTRLLRRLLAGTFTKFRVAIMSVNYALYAVNSLWRLLYCLLFHIPRYLLGLSEKTEKNLTQISKETSAHVFDPAYFGQSNITFLLYVICSIFSHIQLFFISVCSHTSLRWNHISRSVLVMQITILSVFWTSFWR